MAKTYIDDCFDSTIPKRIRNIRIYMSIFDLDQNAVAKQIGYAKSTVSKNISFDATLSNSFAERFCSTYNIPLKYLDYPTTKFYSTILIEKRNKEIEETGEDPGELRDIELLKRYKYKFEEETIPKVVKKDEVIDINFAKDAILYNKKMLYKNAFTKIPAAIAILVGIAALIITVLSLTEASIGYSLFLLILFPISFLFINHFRKNTFSTPVTKYTNTYYELDKEYVCKPLILIQLSEGIIACLFALFIYIAYMNALFNNHPDTFVAFITLCVATFSTIASTLLLFPSTKPFPKRLTKKYMNADILRGVSFYLHIIALIIFIVFYILGYIPLSFVIIEGILVLISLGVFIIERKLN